MGRLPTCRPTRWVRFDIFRETGHGMYSLSLGSKKGNAHLHWHVAHFPGRAYDHRGTTRS